MSEQNLQKVRRNKMKDWYKKCNDLTEASHSNSMVMLDLCAQIHGHTKRLYEKSPDLTNGEARDLHNKLASLKDQLDQVLPRINTIARTVRNIP
jgi:hypothetical protein